MQITPEMVQDSLSKDNYKLYKLIYERFLASQMNEAEYSNVTATIDVNNYNFKATGKTLEFAGYTAVYKEFVDEDKEQKQEISKLPVLNEGEKVEVKDIKFSVSCSVYSDEQIFCFSAMILYESKADSSK